IKDAEAKIHPLVGFKNHVSELYDEYRENNVFLDKLKQLEEKNIANFRRCRGDGNCFYRAFSYRFFEYFLTNATEQEHQDAIKLLENVKAWLKKIGYQEFAFEDFYDMTMEYFQNCRGIVESELVRIFQEDGTSNAIVVFFRLVVSSFLQTHADDYLPFVDGYETMDVFCQAQVEAFGRDADQIHIIALSNALDVKVKVAYLDASDSKISFHEFGPENSKSLCEITLLYRPGHYDLLYQ
ncbi:cysteine proteinase, partial [Rozella allomycis CSF55]